MAKIKYSDDLSTATWKSHQTTIGKLVQKKSGMSEALRELEAAFDAVDQNLFDIDIVGDDVRSSVELTKVLAKAVDHYNKDVAALQKKAKEVRELADDLHGQYTRAKTVPKKTCDHLETISAAADQLIADFGDAYFKEWADRFKNRIARFRRSEEANRAEFLKVTKSFPQDLAQLNMVLQDTDDFDEALKLLLKFWQEGVRSLAAVLNASDYQELKAKHIQVWAKLNSDQAVRAQSIDDIKTYLTKVATAFALLKRDLPD